MKSAGRAAAAAAGVLLFAASLSAEVSTKPESPHFDAIIRPLLTPLENAAQMDALAAEELADSGVLVLEEELRTVDSGARSVVALHRIVKPLTEAGVESASRLVFPYNASYQRVFLHTARTRAPDGTISHLGPDAAFIQTPQHQADQAIYSDEHELVVLFSNVKVGHLVEWIVVVEVDEPRMPGGWGAVIAPGAYWPTVRFRSRVDMEEPLADRLRIVPRGGPLPEFTTPATRQGWRAWEWVANGSAPMRRELDRAPIPQFGPAIRLTTVDSWDAVGRWYRGLLASRSDLAPGLEAQLDEWTAGLDDPRRILEVVLSKVADDVRYTGLEFGLGALQPRPPDTVWSSQYGDCKDKANLLRVMLARRGIDSHIVLVNTEHAGRIEPDAPSYGQFNHAILAVDLPGGWVFCDPTVRGLPPGMLRPSATGRQALLIGSRTAELVTIPSQDGGAVRYSFDIEVGSSGGMKGWMDLSTGGSISSLFADYFKSVDASFRRQRFHSLVDRFFEGADLIDVEFPDPAGTDDLAFTARGYFVVNGVGSHDERRSTMLRFPHGGMVFPDVEDEDERETPWHQDREVVEVEIRYQLPVGWHEQSQLPQPLRVSSPAATAEARWRRAEDGAMIASLAYRTEVDLVGPREFARLRQAVIATRTWMDRPLSVVAGGEAPSYEDRGVAEIDMPLMPTGEGQLRLVNRAYPSDGDRELRRAALLQVQQLFPDSSETLFDVEIWLAQLDAFEDHPELSVPRIERALEMYGEAVPRETVAWAEYHLAHHLQKVGQVDRSVAILEELVANESLTPFRRAAAAELLGALLAEKGDVAGALRVLDRAIAIESEMHAELVDLRARVMVENDRTEDLESALIREMESSPHLADWTFETLAQTVADLMGEGESADAAALAGVLLVVADASPDLQLDDQQLAELLELSRATAAYSEIAAAIGAYLENPSSDWIRDAEAAPAGSVAEMSAAMSRFDDAGQIAEYVRCGLQRLALHGTAVGDFGLELWQLAAITNANRPADPVLDDMIGWGLRLPRRDEYYLETVFLQAEQLERRGSSDEAVTLLRKWSGDPEINSVFRVAFLAELGEALERQGRWDEALEAYGSLEPERGASFSGYDALLRAVFINLELQRFDEALRIIGLLSELDDEMRLYCDSPSQIAELVARAGNPERAKTYWLLQRDWMPVWLSLESAAGIDPSPEIVVPVIPDLMETASEMGRAVSAGAPKSYFEDLRTIVHAARWQPEMLFEVCSLGTTTDRMAGDHRDLSQALVVAMATGLDIGDESVYKRSRQVLATYYVNQDQYPQAVAVGREYFERYEADDPVGRGVLRLWGLAAAESGLDREITAARLEDHLADQALEGERTVTVYVLAHLYETLGLSEKERELIKTEIIDGDIDNDRFAERLERRYASLNDKPVGQAEFDAAVEDWFEAFGPTWFEAAVPYGFAEPLAAQIERDIEDSPERYSRTEIIKFRLLVARDESRPLRDRHQSFGMAVSDLEDLFVDIGDADAMVNAVVGDMRMPAFVRWFVPWMAMDGAIDRGDRRRLETFLARGISAPWDPGRLERLKALADLIPDISDRRSELESSAARLIAGETLDDDGVRVLRLIIERLLQLGEFDLVSELIDTLDRAEFDTVVESSGASLRLELRRLMAEYQAEWPANEAMRSALLDGLGDGMPERPSILDDVADRDRIDHLSDEDQLAIRLYLAATRQYEPPSQLFWALLARGIQDFHEAEVAKQMFERAVAAPMADDALRGFVLMMSTACFDIDNPDDQARLELVMARLRQDFEQPLGRASAVVMSAILATRAGRETDLSAVDDAARELDADWIAASLRLVHASREGTAQLRRLLESMPTDTMIDPYMIPEILLSLRSAGMSSEAELVAEVAREQVLDDMLRSWSAVDGWAVRQVLDLCQALDEEGCFQTSWRDEMAEAFRANEISLRILLLDAELRGDWDTARDTAAAIVAERPKIYDIYWRLGRAEARLGNDAAAADALDIFVRYCGDSLYLREARELLAKLNEEGAD